VNISRILATGYATLAIVALAGAAPVAASTHRAHPPKAHAAGRVVDACNAFLNGYIVRRESRLGYAVQTRPELTKNHVDNTYCRVYWYDFGQYRSYSCNQLLDHSALDVYGILEVVNTRSCTRIA
jgi:hypothetical protein